MNHVGTAAKAVWGSRQGPLEGRSASVNERKYELHQLHFCRLNLSFSSKMFQMNLRFMAELKRKYKVLMSFKKHRLPVI